jgi:hypothetical protein
MNTFKNKMYNSWSSLNKNACDVYSSDQLQPLMCNSELSNPSYINTTLSQANISDKPLCMLRGMKGAWVSLSVLWRWWTNSEACNK